MDSAPSPSTEAPPSEIIAPTVAATEEDDIMAGTTLSTEEQQTALPTPADSQADTPAPAPPAPAEDRRKRVLGTADDKKRAKRLFGGLLGTLSSFKKEERERGASDAAKRRSLITDRIQNKLRVETTVLADIAAKERELKTLKIDLDKKENELTQKTAAFAARHASLPRLASFLHTTASEPAEVAPGARRNPAPLLQLSSAASTSSALPPVGQAAFHKSGDAVTKPLFYLPATLLPAQESKIAERKEAVEAAILAESEEWSQRRDELKQAIDEIHAREPVVQSELAALRQQKSDLASSDHPAASPLPSTNGHRSASVSSQPATPQTVPQQQPETNEDAVPAGESMMDVEGDEAVEY